MNALWNIYGEGEFWNKNERLKGRIMIVCTSCGYGMFINVKGQWKEIG